MRKYLTPALVLALALLLGQEADAQCAMCEAIAESAAEEKPGVGIGLNRAIVFLMLIPYTLFCVVAWVFFRKQIFAFFKKKLSKA